MMSSGRSRQPTCCRGCALAASAIIVGAPRLLADAGRTSLRAHAATARTRQFAEQKDWGFGEVWVGSLQLQWHWTTRERTSTARSVWRRGRAAQWPSWGRGRPERRSVSRVECSSCLEWPSFSPQHMKARNKIELQELSGACLSACLVPTLNS